jgi:hypothetical protein
VSKRIIAILLVAQFLKSCIASLIFFGVPMLTINTMFHFDLQTTLGITLTFFIIFFIISTVKEFNNYNKKLSQK